MCVRRDKRGGGRVFRDRGFGIRRSRFLRNPREAVRRSDAGIACTSSVLQRLISRKFAIQKGRVTPHQFETSG